MLVTLCEEGARAAALTEAGLENKTRRDGYLPRAFMQKRRLNVPTEMLLSHT